MKIYHPDKNPRQSKKQLDHCKAINKAYEILSDPSQRSQYDRNYLSRKVDSESSRHKNDNTRFKYTDQGSTDRENKNQQRKTYNQSQKRSNDQKEKAKPNNDRGSNNNNQNQRSSSNQKRYENDYSRHQEDRSNNNRTNNNSSRSSYQNRDYSHYQENRGSQDRSNYSYHHEDQHRNFGDHNAYQSGTNSEENSDLYEILGLRKNATQSDIKRAYMKLSEKFSPDSANPEIQRQSVRILKAYIILSDSKLRASYDKVDNISNTNSCTNSRFEFLEADHFDSNSDIGTFLKGIYLGCKGCGLVFYVILKWTVKLICITIPPLVKGLFYLAIGIGWTFKSLFRLVIG